MPPGIRRLRAPSGSRVARQRSIERSRGTCRSFSSRRQAGPSGTPEPPAPAPWRPKPRGVGGGGEVAARRRTVPARRTTRAGLGTHSAHGARGPGPPSAPGALKTRRPRATRPAERASRTPASRPLDAPCRHSGRQGVLASVSALGGQSPAGGRPKVGWAVSVLRPSRGRAPRAPGGPRGNSP